VSWFRRAGNAFQYVYFMRSSVLLWPALVLLPVFDCLGWTASVTRGMFALEYSPPHGIFRLGQFIWVGFYVFLGGWFALLSARVVAAYGPERFREADMPDAWRVHGLRLEPKGQGLAIPPQERGRGMRWRVFWGAQIPGAFFLLHTILRSINESYGCSQPAWFRWRAWCLVNDLVGVLLGALFALIVWYTIAFIYYFRRGPKTDSSFHSFFLPPHRIAMASRAIGTRPRRRCDAMAGQKRRPPDEHSGQHWSGVRA